MLVRYVLALGLGLLLAIAVGSPANAFTSGGWDGEANFDGNGRFRDCTMTASFKSGTTLAFIISRDLDWGLVLANDDWKLQVGRSEAATVAIDARDPITSTAKAVDARGILVPLQNSEPVVDALRHGTLLTVASAFGRASFQLTGTQDAIAALAGCVTERLAAEKSATDALRQSDPAPRAAPAQPFDIEAPAARQFVGKLAALEDAAAKQPADAERLLAGNDAVRFVAELLASAGITDYELIDPAKNPMPNFDVVWTYPNGIIGALAAYQHKESVDLDDAAGVVIADDQKHCQGDFSSGQKPSEPTPAVTVRRLFTACHTAEQSVEIHYALLKTESGHLIQIAHLNLGDATGDVATADNPFLQTAVLQNFK
jgi:hypothetical protein